MLPRKELEHDTHNNGTFLRVSRNAFLLQVIVEYLHENPRINTIELNSDIIRNGNVADLQKCTSVHSLTVIGKTLRQNHIIGIANNANLSEVCLHRCGIGNQGARNISKSRSIKVLTVSDCDIGDEGAKELASNKIFETVYISDNQLTDTGAEHFLKNPSLRTIDLSHNPIQSTSVIDALRGAGFTVIADGIPSRQFRP